MLELATKVCVNDIQEVNNRNSTKLTEYSFYLDNFSISYRAYEYYWQVGEISAIQGWILHLSVIISQLVELLDAIIPLFIARKVAFKIVRDKLTAQRLLDGHLGFKNVGKIISIYPVDDLQALDLAKELLGLTEAFKGPGIPTDFCLGGILYTRYGSFNPVLIKSKGGKNVKHIYNPEGTLIADPYSIPFLLPTGINWPFRGIKEPIPSRQNRLLNNRYYPISILKKDVKGDVFKAFYFKRPWRITSCIIKAGYSNIFSDDYGRDIRDRLKWQLHLHQELASLLAIPKCIDFFEENDHAYFAMECINGIPLQDTFSDILQGRSWVTLPTDGRQKIVDYLSQVIKMVECIHERGFIHRDITTENFLADKTGKLFLIDLELSWCSYTESPSPPFQLGTPGYMSPQQINKESPSVKDDIYALGAMFIAAFTNIRPMKFPTESPGQFHKALTALIGEAEISNLIAKCMLDDPSERPELLALKNWIAMEQNTIHNNRGDLGNAISAGKLDHRHIRKIIQSGLNGLSNPNVLSPKNRWISLMENREGYIGNDLLEMTLLPGWHTGMSGPLWLIARAKLAGFDVHLCEIAYARSWEYLYNNYFKDPNALGEGLYDGKAGIAMALSEGLESKLLVNDAMTSEILECCFASTSSELTFSTGVSGQGIALLNVAKYMDREAAKMMLQSYIQLILKNQRSDGSWILKGPGSTKCKKASGFSNGIAGIVWFLLGYLKEQRADPEVRMSTIRALRWLVKKGVGKAFRNLSILNFNSGIVLLFVKAFEVLGDSEYLEMATDMLNCLAPRPSFSNFTLGSGLSCIGEIYMEVGKVANDQRYYDTIDWITELLVNCCRFRHDEDGYWESEIPDSVTADLFSGNGGIIHFLMRYLNSDKLNHPFWPFR